jgi:hypothetical protein
MKRLAAVLSILIGPYLVLRLPGAPQASGRGIIVSVLLLGTPVAILWYGSKSQMIRPGARLWERKFDRVRPKIELGLRILVVAFGVFFFWIATVPVAEDLVLLAAGQNLLRITKTVKYRRYGRPGNPRVSIGLSGEDKVYQLYYPTKVLRVGETYEFVVLPRSRTILDYRASSEVRGSQQ